MTILCRLTAIACALSSLFFLTSGFDALEVRARELDPLLDGPITAFSVLGYEFGDYVAPLFAALAHALLAVVLLCLPGRLNPPKATDLNLGIQGDPGK